MLGFRRFAFTLATRAAEVPKFVLDHQKGQREVVLPKWECKTSRKNVRIERANEKDVDIVATQRCQGFVNNNSLFIKMGATMDDMLPMFYEKTKEIIGQRLSLVAFDEEDRLIAALGCEDIKGNDIFRVFGPKDKPHLFIKDDYGEDIKNGPFPSLNANRYHILCEAATKQTNKFLPENVQKIGRPTALFVHPNFIGEGIGALLYAQCKKLLKNDGCDSWLTFAVVNSSRNVAMRNGMKVLFEFPYKKFKENGVAIFDGLVDGTTEHSIMFEHL